MSLMTTAMPTRAPPRVAQPESEKPIAPSSAQLLRLSSATLAHSSFQAATLALCTELAALLGARRVSLGRLEPRGGVRLVAISHGDLDDLDALTRGALQASIHEACDQATTITSPPTASGSGIDDALRRLRQFHRGPALCVPLSSAGDVIGGLTVEFGGAGISPPAMDLARTLCEDAVALVTPFLQALYDNQQTAFGRLVRALRQTRPRDASGRIKPIWWVGAALAVTLVILCGVPMAVTVGASARVEGATQRVIAAPADGFIKSVLLRPGDPVSAGQVVAELVDRDLQLERGKNAAEILQQENAYAAAMAHNDRANMMIHQAKLSEAQARSALTEQQLARIRLRSPIDGQIIQGDLSQMLGAPVEKGQTLMTAAPLNAFRVIVELDERDIQYVRVGQSGRLSLSALPWQSVPLIIRRIAPMAQVIDGRNVFELEAVPSGATGDMKAGLRGVARVQIGDEPPLPVWSRRLIEHLRRFYWRWEP